ncbi:hypothetical protein R5R35_014569 [Gryllus longicercus]|uniref:Uncharacterized protein n=1 Tax=Gryllus longicercus TaxID=2509291 RepID=A0AAN9VMX1_9ORTH
MASNYNPQRKCGNVHEVTACNCVSIFTSSAAGAAPSLVCGLPRAQLTVASFPCSCVTCAAKAEEITAARTLHAALAYDNNDLRTSYARSNVHGDGEVSGVKDWRNGSTPKKYDTPTRCLRHAPH